MSDWYAQSRAAIQRNYGEDWRLFAGILAATSAHSGLKGNVTMARRVYLQYKATGTISPDRLMPAHYTQLQKVLETGRPSGQKVGAFYDALVGDESAVVVDIWMQRHYKQPERPMSARQYKRLADKLRAEASEAGMTPARYQAQVWSQIRGGGQSYADHMAQMQLL